MLFWELSRGPASPSVLQMRTARHSKIKKFPRPHGKGKVWDSDTGREMVPFTMPPCCIQRENIRVRRSWQGPNFSPRGNPGPGRGRSVHKATQGVLHSTFCLVIRVCHSAEVGR